MFEDLEPTSDYRTLIFASFGIGVSIIGRSTASDPHKQAALLSCSKLRDLLEHQACSGNPSLSRELRLTLNEYMSELVNHLGYPNRHPEDFNIHKLSAATATPIFSLIWQSMRSGGFGSQHGSV